MIKTNFIVYLHVYPFDIMFSVGETDKQLRKMLKKKLSKEAYKIATNSDFLFGDCHGQNAHTQFIKGHWQTIIRLSKDASYGTISHEIFHAVSILLHHLQMPLCPKNDEAYAYLIGYVTDEFYKNAIK